MQSGNEIWLVNKTQYEKYFLQKSWIKKIKITESKKGLFKNKLYNISDC